MNKVICFFLLISFLGINNLYSQQNQLHGKVTLSGEYPILMAEVSLKNSKRSVFTDSLGMFSIRSKKGDRLVVKAAGFKFKSVKVKHLEDTMNIELSFKNTPENIDMASGYGHIDRETLLHSGNHLNVEKTNIHYTNVLEMIRGRFTGVSVVGNEIHIRGTKSLMGSNAALIVINGIVTDMISLKSLPVHEVKNIDVLKGAAATLYGSRGANGVVVITLKDSN